MDSNSLTDYILEGRQHKAESALGYWLANSKRYFEFVHLNKDKIRSKFRNAISDEDIDDVRFELELPYLFFIDDKYTVEYEKFGNGRRRAPDFTIQHDGALQFNVEVNRIREGSLGTRYEEVIKKIIAPIRNIPSSLGFSISALDFDLNEDFITSLEHSVEQFVNQIRTLIIEEETKIPYDSCFDYPLLGFKDKIVITLSRPSGKKNLSRTSYYGGLDPIFFTNKECFKFGDTIFEKLGQCIPGMINILFISTNSSTHEPEDVLESIASINHLIKKQDNNFFERKGFDGIDDFVNALKNLSGIVCKTTWVSLESNFNLVWCNGNAAWQFPQELKNYMKFMGRTDR